MKHRPTIALVVIGLAYVIGAQIVMHERHAPTEAAASAPTEAAASARESVPAASRRAPVPRPAEDQRSLAFGGYPCRPDCADDRAGYRWARTNHIDDPDDCTGSSGPFIEGCRVYARQRSASIGAR